MKAPSISRANSESIRLVSRAGAKKREFVFLPHVLLAGPLKKIAKHLKRAFKVWVSGKLLGKMDIFIFHH